MSETPILSTAASSSVVSPGTIATPTAEPTNDDNSTVVVDELDPLLGSTSEPAKTGENVVDPAATNTKLARLNFLLEQSSVYTKILTDKMERQRQEKARAESRAANKEAKFAAPGPEPDVAGGAKKETRSGLSGATAGEKPKVKGGPAEGLSEKATGKRKADEVDEGTIQEAIGAGDQASKRAKQNDEPEPQFKQPDLITGGILRDFQLAGLQWMISLYENGLNGIMADEMGLGKTLQTISFIAHLKSKNVWGPFMVVCPLSVLHNWSAEFERFAPGIPILQYHGTPMERQELRRTRLTPPSDAGAGASGALGGGRKVKPVGKKAKKAAANREPVVQNTMATFPVVIVTYDIAMIDAAFLRGFQWKYIVVDEGHRLKNLNCKLIRELKSYTSANRLILTGTPLHNNLSELWSLLNFILPDIFDDLDSFQQWFDLDTSIKDTSDSALISSEQSNGIVSKLHAILKPFLLRRLKTDVEKSLPPKKEYLLHAPITKQQKVLYEAVLERNIRSFLIQQKSGADAPVEAKPVFEEQEQEQEQEQLDENGLPMRVTRGGKKKDYEIEDDDDKYFDDLEDSIGQPVEELSAVDLGREYKNKAATKTVNNMNLQNIVMQLRKVASHPFLFDWPIDPNTGTEVINHDLVEASGKMLLLNRLLEALFARKHKVLVFSQFTKQLDILEDWATSFKGWKICRIDGSTTQDRRRTQMKEFNEAGEEDGVCRLFLLSTRAGGLGINLVAADTVIFYDQDWNPQMDLQAQDRAHRIGQKRPVLIFRLVTAHTIETKILQRANAKRHLEALVIAEGKFRGESSKAKGSATLDEAANLLKLQGDNINLVNAGDKIISDEDLEQLLDRSPEAFSREIGWHSSGKEATTKKEATMFEVYQAAKDDVNDGLAAMKKDE